MGPKKTLHAYMSGGTAVMTVDPHKLFMNLIMEGTVAETLKEAFDYCQDTFNLTPLGIQVPTRDISEVKEKATRSKVYWTIKK